MNMFKNNNITFKKMKIFFLPTEFVYQYQFYSVGYIRIFLLVHRLYEKK